MKGLFTENIVITERTGEDASGVGTTRVTTVRGYSEFLSAQAKQATGNASANASFAALDASGFGTAWDLEPGDSLALRDIIVNVISVRPVYAPRSNSLHHIEASAG